MKELVLMGKRKQVKEKVYAVGYSVWATQLGNFHAHMPDEWDETFYNIEDSITHAVQDQWNRHRQNLRDVRRTAEIKNCLDEEYQL